MSSEISPRELAQKCAERFAFLVDRFGFRRVEPSSPFVYALRGENLELDIKAEDHGTFVVATLWRRDRAGGDAFIYVNTLIELLAPELWKKAPCEYSDTFTRLDAIGYYATGLEKVGGRLLCGDLSIWDVCKQREAQQMQQARRVERR